MSSPHLTEEQQAQILAELAKKDELARQAAANPLPGPLTDVFAIQQDIQVGQWTVRPFYDIDFEFLHTLEHPLAVMMAKGIQGQTQDTVAYIPRGPDAWVLAWIMTRSPEDVEAVFKRSITEVRERAKNEFSKLQLGALYALNMAIIRQLERYWSPVLSYGPAKVPESKNEDGKEETKEVMAENPFQRTGAQ